MPTQQPPHKEKSVSLSPLTSEQALFAALNTPPPKPVKKKPARKTRPTKGR